MLVNVDVELGKTPPTWMGTPLGRHTATASLISSPAPTAPSVSDQMSEARVTLAMGKSLFYATVASPTARSSFQLSRPPSWILLCDKHERELSAGHFHISSLTPSNSCASR
jgi:hypothetical protein